MASLAWQTFKPTHKGLLGNPRKYQPAQKGISSQLGLNGNSESRSAAECKQHTYTSLLNSISPFAGGRDQAQPQQVAFLCPRLLLAKNQHLKHRS